MPVMESDFRSFIARTLAVLPGGLSSERAAEYAEVTDRIAARLEGPRPWSGIPGAVRRVFSPRGFLWNGFYVLCEDRLVLGAAAGPPVCAELPRRGGVHTSGLCWDGILMNQTIAVARVADWPGYVSCDGESGLRTRSGLVVPIRDASGRPVAVWDLDCTAELAPEDPFFFDRVFATLSALLGPDPADLAAVP